MDSLIGSLATLEDTGFEKEIESGECRTSALQLASADGVRCGLWQCTPGAWRSKWETWEIFTVIHGAGTLTDDTGTVHVLEPGAVVHIPAGSSGRWEVAETLRKSFVAPAKPSR